MVEATGGANGGAGIGGGYGSTGGDIEIAGGTIAATGANGGAGIGTGNGGAGGTLVVDGGSIKTAGAAGPQAKNSAGADVYLNALTIGTTAVAGGTAVTAGVIGGVDCAETPDAPQGVYGIQDVTADAAGAVYFYLTGTSGVDEPVELMTSAGDVYGKSYARTAANGNAQTLPFLYALPRVTSVAPSGAGAPVNGYLTITFDKAMDTNVTGTATLNGVIALDASAGSWSNSDRTVAIPYASLSPGAAYTVSISGFKGVSGGEMLADDGYSFTTDTHIYAVAVDPASCDFGATTYGYVPVTPQTFAVSNTGDGALNDLTATLEGAGAAAFEISAPFGGAPIAPGAVATVGVKPRDNLSVGIYAAALKIESANGVALTVALHFAVGKATPAIDDLAFKLPNKAVYYAGLPHAIPATTKDPAVDMGLITTTYNGSAEPPSAPGIYVVAIEVAGNANYLPATFEIGRLVIINPSEPVVRRQVTIEPTSYFTVDPSPGVHYVDSYDHLTITLAPTALLPAGYVPVVATDRRIYPDDKGGVRITANGDGTYTVRILFITENAVVTITASADLSAGPNATEPVAAAPNVWSHADRLYIVAAATSGRAYIYNISGHLIKILPYASGETLSQPLKAGIYVVAIDGRKYKVVIY
jgi:hypothetical protein